MPIYVDLANLIIEKKTILEKYQGGMEQFRQDYNFGEGSVNQEDDLLFSLAAMNVGDFQVELLVAKGLHFDSAAQCSTDFVVIERYGDFNWKYDGLVHNNVFVWHINTPIPKIERAKEIGNMLMDDLLKLMDAGENPLKTIV
ncbi:MAG: hypothetical protein IPK10_01130 [Bacteroidetes bacterium]|nr:hypothetical protein [Bacteroidota bacterium]